MISASVKDTPSGKFEYLMSCGRIAIFLKQEDVVPSATGRKVTQGGTPASYAVNLAVKPRDTKVGLPSAPPNQTVVGQSWQRRD